MSTILETLETLEVSRGDGVINVTLNRPAEANSLSVALAQELRLVAADAESDPGCHVLVLRGNGAFFCAGGDVKGMAAAQDRVAYVRELAGTMHDVMLALRASRLVVVAVVDGPTAGAGLGLVLNSDIVLVTPRASFLSAYGKVGLTPDCGVSYLLPLTIGERRAAAVLLAGQSISAQQSLDWGLATELCEADTIEARVTELGARLAGGATQSLGPTKKLLAGDVTRYADHLAAEADSIARISVHSDSSARIAAFAERSR